MRTQQVICQEPVQYEARVQLWEPEVSREQGAQGLVLHVEETGVRISLVFSDEQVFERFIKRTLACQTETTHPAKAARPAKAGGAR